MVVSRRSRDHPCQASQACGLPENGCGDDSGICRVVDDEPDILAFSQEGLTRLGHHVVLAEDGRSLLELCRTVQPDLIVTDKRLAALDDSEALKGVWKERSVPALLVSADPPDDLPHQVPVCLLRKPVNLLNLQEAIEQVLGHTGWPMCSQPTSPGQQPNTSSS